MTAYDKGGRFAAEFIRAYNLQDMPDEVRDHARICLLDLVGACLAGSSAHGSAILTDFVSEQFGGAREATIIGSGIRTSCTAAALVNGFTSNALDIDDGHRLCKGHPGAVIFPAILAAAEKYGASGSDLLQALVIGYEVTIRAASILFGHYGYYHGSGSWGAIGAAAACARIMNLSEEQTLNALGIAEGYAPLSDVMRSVKWPAMAPKDGIAWGSMVGISAALLAEKGFTGSPSLLGDNEHNEDIYSLGRVWRIKELYFKPYPCCRWSQPSIEAVFSIIGESGITHRDITRIVIHTFDESATLSPEAPVDMESAEYNILFPAAVALVHGDFNPAHLNEEIFQDKDVLRIMDLMETVTDPEIQNHFPAKCRSRVEVHTGDGRVLDSGLFTSRGDWDLSPLSRDELTDKFIKITTGMLEKDRIIELIDLVLDIENHQTEELIAFLA